MPSADSRQLATFPACECCARPIIAPVSDAPICFRLPGGEAHTIPRSQKAQLLRFLWRMRGQWVVVEHMVLATGKCFQYSRALDSLRNGLGIPILCEAADKRTKPGKFGLYALSKEVDVWEPESAGAAEAGEA